MTVPGLQHVSPRCPHGPPVDVVELVVELPPVVDVELDVVVELPPVVVLELVVLDEQ